MRPAAIKNTKARVNLTCPGCGLELGTQVGGGYVQANETFCCEGCATGSGCTCRGAFRRQPANNRFGNRGQRNKDNTPADKNFNKEVDSSGHALGKRRPTEKAPARQESRDQRGPLGQKRPRSQSETRPSTRQQARGRSENRGRLNKRVSRSGGADRVSKTGTKSH